jgi:hypothetical protein
VIPKEVKMADIIKSDVRTYVRDLIAKEFGSNKNGINDPSDNLKKAMGGYRDEQDQPLYSEPLKVSEWRDTH